MQGLQIGGGSACEVTDNFLAHGSATGIIVLDAADTLLANNVIVDFVDGIYINDRDSEVSEGAQVRVAHNTVVESAERGITIFGTRSAGNLFYNNLVVSGGTNPFGIGGDVDVAEGGNVLLEQVGEALFSDSDGEDYSLSEGAPGIDVGVSLATLGVDVDQRGAPRDASPDAGAFEFGAEAPDEPVSPPGPGKNPSETPGGGDDSTDDEQKTSDSSGCSCRSSGGVFSSPSPGMSFGILLFSVYLRRRKRAART
jgi:hypothetical protein